MNRPDYDNFIDPADLSLDSILEEYQQETLGENAISQFFPEDPARRISAEDDGDVVSAHIDEPPPPAPETAQDDFSQEDADFEEYRDEEFFEEPFEDEEYLDPEQPSEYEAEYDTGYYSDEDESGYADADYPEYDDADDSDYDDEREKRGGFSIMTPIISIMAAIMVRRQQRKAEEAQTAAADEEEEQIPEAPPAKAAKLYSSQAAPLKLRRNIAAILCLILTYISYAYGRLPLPGALSGNIRVAALMCLLLELVIILIGLDIFTNGMTTLLRGRPGAESLVSVSCIFSVIDAVIIAVTANEGLGLPFCAVSSLSMLFAIWGYGVFCSGMKTSLRTAAMGASPFVVNAERGIDGDGGVLLKSRRDIGGFTRRSEEADGVEAAYITAAPLFLVSSLVLAVLAAIIGGHFKDVIHCISALTAVCASFSALLSFSMPFSIISKRLAGSGAALAGWAGVSDIGKSKRTVITDSDIFPPATLTIGTIRILEGVFTDRVISYTGSMMIASGASAASAFTELMRRNGCAMQPIEDFKCHDGGGIIGNIRGEQVYVGTSGFMNLLGIRLPQSQISKSAIFTAINNELVGVFSVSYTPTAAVQDALVSMLHSRGYSPLFAIRDFNITPLLIKQKFRMPTEGFEFPSVSERYRISAAVPGEDSPPCAVLSRDGLAPLVEATTGGKNVYNASRLNIIISIAGSLAGMILMFFLCLSGSFDSAGVSNMMTYMFLWLVPVVVINLGLRR